MFPWSGTIEPNSGGSISPIFLVHGVGIFLGIHCCTAFSTQPGPMEKSKKIFSNRTWTKKYKPTSSYENKQADLWHKMEEIKLSKIKVQGRVIWSKFEEQCKVIWSKIKLQGKVKWCKTKVQGKFTWNKIKVLGKATWSGWS